MTQAYPDLDLVGKVNLPGLGNDQAQNHDAAEISGGPNNRPKRDVTKPSWMKDFQIQ